MDSPPLSACIRKWSGHIFFGKSTWYHCSVYDGCDNKLREISRREIFVERANNAYDCCGGWHYQLHDAYCSPFAVWVTICAGQLKCHVFRLGVTPCLTHTDSEGPQYDSDRTQNDSLGFSSFMKRLKAGIAHQSTLAFNVVFVSQIVSINYLQRFFVIWMLRTLLFWSTWNHTSTISWSSLIGVKWERYIETRDATKTSGRSEKRKRYQG